MMKLSQVSLRFLGIPLPPSGGATMFLFGDPDPAAPRSSLGWYAAYVNP